MQAAVLAPSLNRASFFGSGGAETQLTPANSASPLNPSNVAGITYRTNVADVSAFGEIVGKAWKVRVKIRGDASDQSSDRLRTGEPNKKVGTIRNVKISNVTITDVVAGRNHGPAHAATISGRPESRTDHPARRAASRPATLSVTKRTVVTGLGS